MAILAPMYNEIDGWHIVTTGPNGQTQTVHFDSAQSYYEVMGVSPIDDDMYYEYEEEDYDEEDDIYDEEDEIYDDDMEDSYYNEIGNIVNDMMEDLETVVEVGQIYDSMSHIIESASTSSASFSDLLPLSASISPKMESKPDSESISFVTEYCAADQSAEQPCFLP